MRNPDPFFCILAGLCLLLLLKSDLHAQENCILPFKFDENLTFRQSNALEKKLGHWIKSHEKCTEAYFERFKFRKNLELFDLAIEDINLCIDRFEDSLKYTLAKVELFEYIASTNFSISETCKPCGDYLEDHSINTQQILQEAYTTAYAHLIKHGPEEKLLIKLIQLCDQLNQKEIACSHYNKLKLNYSKSTFYYNCP